MSITFEPTEYITTWWTAMVLYLCLLFHIFDADTLDAFMCQQVLIIILPVFVSFFLYDLLLFVMLLSSNIVPWVCGMPSSHCRRAVDPKGIRID